MENKNRRFKRYSIDSVKIKGTMVFARTVDIIDISMSGVSLKLDRRLNIGIDYPLEIEGNGNRISVNGTVIWVSLHESRKTTTGDLIPIYAIGMKFNNISKEKITELIEFIESHSKVKLDPGHVHRPSGLRFHMRFQVNASGETVLMCSESFAVKKISMGGMFIETGDILKVEEKLPMEILLPDHSVISFLGRIVSCLLIKDRETKLYAIGVEFLNMPEDHSTKLDGFISMLSQEDLPSSCP